MGKHSRPRMFRKFVCIVSFVLCWQFGYGLRDRTAALLTPSTGGSQERSYIPKNRTNGTGQISDCDRIQGLPCDEAEALKTVLGELGLDSKTVTRLFCDNINKTMFSCSTPENKPHHVTRISILGSTLNGYLNQSVSDLKFLETLIIYDSQLSGSIPYLGKLSRLQQLSLGKNQLTGPIPRSLGYLENLELFDLSENQLNGSIPRTLGDLSKLKYMRLASNQLTGGIPQKFKNLKALTDLYLNQNLLDGNLSILSELSSLERLDLSYNRFNGHIPKWANLTSLELLVLDENLLTGHIPEELGQLINLEYLSLTSNNLTGELPQNFSNLAQLQRFEVGGNNLSGRIPSYIKDWDNLFYLNLLGNYFEGPLPLEILQMSNLQKLLVSDLKKHSSKFPDNANLTNIDSLVMRNCLIEGQIPSVIGNWTFIDYLDLSFNKLDGEIPDTLNQTYLTALYLEGNMLSGPIPEWIQELEKKDLSYNNFIDVAYPGTQNGYMAPDQTNNVTDVPNMIIHETTITNWSDEFCQNRSRNTKLAINSGGERVLNEGTYYDADESLSTQYVSANRNWAYTCSGDFISGTYNSSVYIKNMTCGVPNVSNEPLHKRARLCPVNLTYYMFCLKKGSYRVKLYFAETIYVDNSDYSSLGQRVFDVYVQGKKELQDFNIKQWAGGSNKEYMHVIKKAEVGDDNLLKISLSWAGKGSIRRPTQLNGPLISAIAVIPNYIVGLSKTQMAVVIAAAIFALVLLLALLWRLDLIGDRELRGKRFKIQNKSYSLKKIISATGNFANSKRISRGYFGILYKAELPDQTVVAVRKLDTELMQQHGDRIIKEYYTLEHLQHENLVRFLGGYSKGDLHLLIYEFTGNLSLEKALFEDPEEALKHNWEARLKICKDVAKGLKYLHEDSNFQIIHGDVKATNILLDESASPPTAKLSDFGLANFEEEENPFSVTKDKRNLMYIAPEYASMTPITVKADVYSFGVLLLEIVSCKRALEDKGAPEAKGAPENKQEETKILLYEANQLYREKRSKELVGGRLSGKDMEQASTFVALAMKCTDLIPDHRPKMSEVLSVLEGEKTVDQIPQAASPSKTG